MIFLDEKKKIVLSNFFYLGLLQGFNSILPLLTLPYLFRVLGPEYFGLVAFATATMTYFNLFVDYGFNLTGTNQISKSRNDNEKINQIFNAILAIKLLITFVCFVVLALIIFLVGNYYEYKFFYFIAFGSVVGQAITPVWFFQGLESMRYITLLNIFSKIIFTVCVFIFVNSKSDYWMVPLFNSLGFLVSGLISLAVVYFCFKVRFISSSITELKKQFSGGFHVFISSISVSLYSNSILIFLGFFCGNSSVGFFSVADKIVQGVKGIYQPLSLAIYPYLAIKFNQNNTDVRVTIKNMLFLFGVPMFFLCCCLFVFSGDIVNILFGYGSYQTILMLRVMAFLPFLGVLSNIFGVQAMLNLGYKVEFTKILMTAAFFGVFGSFVFIPRFGGDGASYVLLAVELFVTLKMAHFVFKTIKYGIRDV